MSSEFEFLEVYYSNICYLSGVRTFESSETHKYLSLWVFFSFLCEISVGIILRSLWRILEHRYSKNQPRKYPGMNFKYLCQNTKIKKTCCQFSMYSLYNTYRWNYLFIWLLFNFWNRSDFFEHFHQFGRLLKMKIEEMCWE